LSFADKARFAAVWLWGAVAASLLCWTAAGLTSNSVTANAT
jgi:hypothetical protein